MPLKLSRPAEDDTDLIYECGATRFGMDVADRYAANIDRALVLIERHPHIARLREEVDGRTRAYPVGTHLIIYEVDDESNVLVLRIRHAREDWQHID